MLRLRPLQFLVVLAVGTILSPAMRAQVTLTMSKSGNDIVLNWSGGSGTYDLIRSSTFRMSVNTDLLLEESTDTGYTDVGALAANLTPRLYTYAISDFATKPMLNIDEPCDTPTGGPLCTVAPTPPSANSTSVSGTTDSAGAIYVNERLATPGKGVFSVSAVQLFLGINVITAATRNANGDWAVDSIQVDRQIGNQPPTITVTAPANGTTIYTRTPLIQINYSDPEGFINTANLAVFVDGTDQTSKFGTPTATQATWQVGTGDALEPGTHFVYATIRDTAPSGASATSEFTISNPVINSFSPAAEGRVGDTISIVGAGFDPTPANNSVKFNGVAAAISGATTTTLTVVVPSDAQTGPVIVTVDTRPSNGKTFRVLLASGLSSIGGIAVNPAVSNHVFFTDGGSGGGLFEILGNGSVTQRCVAANPLGIAIDSSGNVLFGRDESSPNPLYRYQPGGSCGVYVTDTRTAGQSTASIGSIAIATVAGNTNIYLDDYSNTRIKRIDPGLAVSIIANDGTAFRDGIAVTSDGGTLYYTEFGDLLTIPAPTGGTPTVAKTDAAGQMHGLAMTATGNKLVVARAGAGAVSTLDPTSPTNPFFDLATGLSSPRAVALGSDEGSGPFVVVAEPTRIFRLPKPSISITNAADAPLPAKVVADFPSSAATCIDDNMISLKVKFSPTAFIPDTTPKQKVTWTVLDPDDPSSDPVIDTNDTPIPNSGDDNITMIGSYDQWVQVPGFSLTGSAVSASVETEIVGGVSQVIFRMSCHPGDNYQFRAGVNVPVYGDIDSTSGVVTVWRRLHIESDSMGPGVGPFEADDVPIDDVPETMLTFFENAFRPAYVEVALPTDTGQNTPNLTFRNNLASTADAVIAAQGRLGRGTTSREGYWVAYAQGNYEGPIDHDNDPDTEPGTVEFGLTNGLKGRYSLTFVESMRDASLEPPGLDNYYLNATIGLHEIGHQFGFDNDTGCVMNQPFPIIRPVFCGSQIRAIREIDAPSLLE